MFFPDHGGVQWLVVFLGNPGLKYQNTRHNAGFLTADVVEKDCGVRIDRLRFHALTAQAELGGQKVLLMKPQTFMNLSGRSVAAAARYYNIPPEHIVVVYDDKDMALGKLRIRAKGSAGSHNGMKSVIECLGTEEFPRVRFGIGKPPEGMRLMDYVLHHLSREEQRLYAESAEKSAQAAMEIVVHGLEAAQQKYSSK